MEILGWTPRSGAYEEVDVCDTFQVPLENWRKNQTNKLQAPPVKAVARVASPTVASTSSPYYKPPTAARRARGPEHIPRPRNSFIIFRCDYTRKNCNGSGDSGCSDAEKKSLSKRAGEAWKCVPEGVKEHYKGLAEKEKEAHAKQNPEYRFKPQRRQVPGKDRELTRKQKVEAYSNRVQASKVHGLKTESPRSRSSSVSSALSTSEHPIESASPAFSPISIPPTPASSVLYLSGSSRPSSPDLYPSSSSSFGPRSPYTPIDSPTEEYPRDPFKNFGRDPLLPLSAEALNDNLYLNYDDSQTFDMLCGNLSPYVYTDCYVPAENQPMPSQMMMPTANLPPPPLHLVASSLSGWDGNAEPSTARPTLDGSFEGVFDEYLAMSRGPQRPDYDPWAYNTLYSGIENNLDTYVLGLNEYGIVSSFNVAATAFPPPPS